MTPHDLFLSVKPSDLVEAHNEAYPNTRLSETFYVEDFLPLIENKTLDPNTDGWSVSVDHIKTTHDDPCDDTENISVGCIDSQGKEWSMSFTPWAQVLNYDIMNRVHFPMSDAQIAAHIFWELTFNGLEDDMEIQAQSLKDGLKDHEETMAQHEADIAAGLAEKDSLPDGYKSMDDVFDHIYNDETPDARVKRLKQQEIYRKNMQSEKTYKNGVLVTREYTSDT